MEENKYYTPSIEEFCVGFEFEFEGCDYNWHSTGWDKVVFTGKTGYPGYQDLSSDDIVKLYNSEESNRFRVKYLDFQDIIDCGFHLVDNNPVRQKWVAELSFEVEDCRIEFLPYIDFIPENIQGKILIFDTLNYGYRLIFKGTIKNKHELKTVLKMIGAL